MRTLTRKLLSLLLAFTMVCAMVPAAMAAETGTPQEQPSQGESQEPEEGDGGEVTPGPGEHEHKYTIEDKSDSRWKDATCTEDGTKVLKCSVEGCNETKTETVPAMGHEWATEWSYGNTAHWHACTREGCEAQNDRADHSKTGFGWYNNFYHTFSCSVCKASGLTETHTFEYIKSTIPGKHIKYCDICDFSHDGDSTIIEDCHAFTYEKVDNLTHNKVCADCKQVVETNLPHVYDESGNKCVCGAEAPGAVTLDENSITLNGRNDSEWLTATVDFPGYDASDVTWKTSDYRIVDLSDNEGSSVRLYAMGNGDATVTATLKTASGTFSATCRVYVKGVDAEISVGATVFNTNPGYALGDEDDDGDTSIVDQIRDEIDDITDGDEDLDYVRFYSPVSYKNEGELDVSTKESYYLDPGKNDEDISDVVFIPDEEYKGKVTFTFLAVDTANDEYEGEIVFDVQEGTASAGDIIYPAKSGDDVEFDVNDFEDFWEDKYSKGSLDYVTFGSISSSRGDLVDADGDKVSSRTKYYADPTSKQADLDGITFEPGRNTKTTVTIDFTAHGTNNSKRDAELSGTVVILYTEKDPEAIVYSSTGKNITLDADDFLDNYKDTMGSSASNIQIQFLEVPSNGTLYYNYNERTEKGTELTSKNVANHTFSTSSRASKSIEDVTYVPDSRGRSDTVRFACYTSGGDLRYYGEVTFGQTVQNVTVNMTSTSSGVTFQASTFFNADDALLSANTISFGTPSSGTLYKNWNGTSGTRVTASDMFSYVASVTGNASISTVTYVPVAGYSGTVTIPFSAYGAAGGIVSGTVSIRVTATTPTTIFTDVPTTGSQAWAYPFINRLAAAGVVSGVTPTTYGPKQTVKWGEALKMVLLGAGHPAQVEGTGSNWASGYLTYAVNNGIVSNTNINLSSNITRLEMAELAAKALGMSPASRINTGIVGPTDTTNGYVYALYNAGIVGGDSSSGQNRYNGGSTLLRDEMAKIVCGVMDNA